MKTLTRTEALDVLRKQCLALVDDEHSLCEVAGRLQILCKGFSQWSFQELKDRNKWLTTRRRHMTRAEMESLLNRWELARQFVNDQGLPCDNNLTDRHHPLCKGWDEFDEATLAGFVAELTGEAVEVRPDAVRPGAEVQRAPAD